MAKIGYVQMPQDDVAQIEQVIREYRSEPAKGLAHGVQKDAIQNALGARAIEKERDAFSIWGICFELLKVNGDDALVFWDEGTLGLTGGILTAEQISEGISKRNFERDQRLSRFLARFVSGGDIGPGLFGRGKLIFQGASQTHSILVDSIRNDDGLYIALDRKIERNRLVQLDIPYQGKEAEKFIAEKAGGALKPLKKPGTRVAILNLDPEIVEAFKLSFSTSPTAYSASFAQMIEETWWEIIQFGAKIILKDGTNCLQVQLHDPLKTIITARDKENGIRVHEPPNPKITIDGKRYRIKKLRLVVLPGTLEEAYREIWVQRKRMRIGKPYRYLDAHPKINRRYAGYIVLEHDLEDLIEAAEGLTHYGFDLRKNGIKQIRRVLMAELRGFERKLGLTPVSEDTASHDRMLKVMREISEYAAELGLMTTESAGIRKSNAEITVKDMKLPNAETLRVEFGDKVGPVDYKLTSTAETHLIGVFQVEARQPRREAVQLYKQQHNLVPKASVDITVPQFEISKDRFKIGMPLDITASYFDQDSGSKHASVHRRIYLGTEPPEPPERPVQLTVTAKFPRKKTKRVEMSDVVRNIEVKATNKTPFALSVHITSSIRYVENREIGRPTTPLFNLLDEKKVVLKGLTDHTAYVDDIAITQGKFSAVSSATATIRERTCDIFATVRLAEDCPELDKPRGWTLDKVSIRFYLGVDPPGHNIFRDTQNPEAPKDGRPSWYDGSTESGYICFINMGHPSYRFIQQRGDEAVLEQYSREQMVRQAYLVAFENEIYKGPAAEFKERLTDKDLSLHEAVELHDSIVGTALGKISGG